MREEFYTYYDLSTSNMLKHKDKRKVLAYKIKTENMTQCFLRQIDIKLVNPAAYNVSEFLHAGEEFIKVNEDIYNKYLDIVNNKSRVSLNSLERLI